MVTYNKTAIRNAETTTVTPKTQCHKFVYAAMCTMSRFALCSKCASWTLSFCNMHYTVCVVWQFGSVLSVHSDCCSALICLTWNYSGNIHISKCCSLTIHYSSVYMLNQLFIPLHGTFHLSS